MHTLQQRPSLVSSLKPLSGRTRSDRSTASRTIYSFHPVRKRQTTRPFQVIKSKSLIFPPAWYTMDHSPAFELCPVQHKDIPRLAHIHVIACLPDNSFQPYFDTPTDFEKGVMEMLEGQIGDSTWQHIKPVDEKTGVLAAWASWNTPTDAQIRERLPLSLHAEATEGALKAC